MSFQNIGLDIHLHAKRTKLFGCQDSRTEAGWSETDIEITMIALKVHRKYIWRQIDFHTNREMH